MNSFTENPRIFIDIMISKSTTCFTVITLEHANENECSVDMNFNSHLVNPNIFRYEVSIKSYLKSHVMIT